MTLLFALACGPSVATLDAEPTDTGGGVEDSEPDNGGGGEHLLDVAINEFMAENNQSYVTDDGLSPDWIELYNKTEFDIELEGYLLRDDFQGEPSVISGPLTLPAGGFVLLFADGGEGGSGPQHLDFKLSSDGEQLGLYTPEDKPLDLVQFGGQIRDTSLARGEDGVDDTWEYVPLGTPGESNEVED